MEVVLDVYLRMWNVPCLPTVRLCMDDDPGDKYACNWPLEKGVGAIFRGVTPDWLDVVEMKFRYPFSCITAASHHIEALPPDWFLAAAAHAIVGRLHLPCFQLSTLLRFLPAAALAWLAGWLAAGPNRKAPDAGGPFLNLDFWAFLACDLV